MIHHSVRLRAHLVVREGGDEALGDPEVQRIHVQDVLKHWWSRFRGARGVACTSASTELTVAPILPAGAAGRRQEPQLLFPEHRQDFAATLGAWPHRMP